MSNKGIAVLAFIALLVVGMAGAVWYRNNSLSMRTNVDKGLNNSTPYQSVAHNIPNDTEKNTHEYSKNLIKPKNGQPIKKFTLVAKESNLLIKDDMALPVWTYNGKVPGEEIRVVQGDFLQVELKNELKDPVTIHWHGYPLISAMDGVPSINQDSIRPGETFTYEFSADVPGTYWYHSHQEGSKQVDKGLYGALIVEPKEKLRSNKEFTLILDEWMSDPKGMEEMENTGHNTSQTDNSMDGMDMSRSQGSTGHQGVDMSGGSAMSEEEMMAYMYDIYTVNGKSGNLIKPLEVNKGDIVRLRFINAGYRTHGMHISGQDIKIVSTDGQDIKGAGIIKDQVIMIAPGERYDVEFTVNSNDNFTIDAHDDNAYNDQLMVPVIVNGGSGKVEEESITDELPVFDLTSYGSTGAGEFTLNQVYDVDYNVELNTRMDGKVQKYTINGKTFDELPPLEVRTGYLVKFTFDNKSTMDHPMHLHGHFFQVLSKDGKPITGAPIMKDTLLVRPGEKYVVAFEANNTGHWVQHCHELHHAAGGMMQEIKYTDYKSNYTPNPNNKFNNPE
ncbi:MAG: multicopper oxidase family protein [Clostridia bacterium]|nr:multicopper oxidase family protein [Clostridia bacterium]